MGNLQPLITQTLLPGAKEAYGQLPLQDFNLREQQPVTAYGQVTYLLLYYRVDNTRAKTYIYLS